VGQFELNCDRGVHKHEVTEQDPFLGSYPYTIAASFRQGGFGPSEGF
jgi:hypothetical protein